MSLDIQVAAFSACECCDVICSRKNDWDRHILTAKHRKNVSLDVSANSNVPNYSCNICDYSCFGKYSWTKHIHTKKHKRNFLDEKLLKVPQIPQNEYTCEKCSKIYDKYNSYWAHSKKCSGSKPESNVSLLISQLIADNKELRNFIIEQASEHKKDTLDIVNKVIENVKPVTNTNNNTINGNVNNNQKFNINVFLNEQCKDAINFSDFIKNITVSREDLENNAQLGFVGGFSKILIEHLKQLDKSERPIHCTDIKRETMYIKDDDKWNKEEDSSKLNKAIQEVTRKSMISLLDWKEDNPDYKDNDSEFSNRCIVIQQQSMAAHNRATYYPKVIHAIAKEIMVDK
jgi:hypothetical protein